MAAKRDYYEILGVQKSADADMIKKAYRKLAKKYHPDTNAGNAQSEQKFKEVTEAYTILSDPEKKKLYDQFGHTAFDGTGQESGAYRDPGSGYQEYHFEKGNMDDILKDIFGDMFHGRSTGSFEYQNFGMRGSDLQSEVTISFDEAVTGCEKIIHLQHMEKRDGSVQSLQVHIPAGIENGKSIRLRGKGMPGANGGDSGDLLLKVSVGTKPGFERKGMDIYTTVSIPFPTAVFGGEVRVTTLYGDVMCRIREGTQSGTKIRLRGKGVVSMKNPNVHGDQYVTVQIQVPKDLSQEAKKKLKDYEQACGQTIRRNKNQHAA